MNATMLNRRCYHWLLLLVLSFYACNNAPTNLNNNNQTDIQQKKDKSQIANNLQDSNYPFLPDRFTTAPNELKEGWRLFMQNGHYRIAKPDDFRFPEEAYKIIPSLTQRMEEPYISIQWDIKNDGKYYHFAAMVIDTTKGDEAKFGFVIFSPTKKQGEPYKAYWIYQNVDLSKTVIDGASHLIGLRSYSDDGHTRACYISWDKNRKKYICKY